VIAWLHITLAVLAFREDVGFITRNERFQGVSVRGAARRVCVLSLSFPAPSAPPYPHPPSERARSNCGVVDFYKMKWGG